MVRRGSTRRTGSQRSIRYQQQRLQPLLPPFPPLPPFIPPLLPFMPPLLGFVLPYIMPALDPFFMSIPFLQVWLNSHQAFLRVLPWICQVKTENEPLSS